MTARDPDAGGDPAADPRATYDHRGGREDSALAEALRERVDGEVRFDDYSRSVYATDASAYEVTPHGVVFPRDTDDVAAAVSVCADRGVAVLPRGGGTSLAGQAVNEAVVLDCTRHLDAVHEVDPDRRLARAGPGVTLGELNARLEEHGLKFAPDPAWGDKSVLGGAIGNNSTGAHSLVYGKTDAYLEECEVVLADGSVATLGEVDLPTLRERADPEGDLLGRIHEAVRAVVEDEADAVREASPDLKRNVSGYNLDRLVEEAADGSVNLARLLAGSEGTLAVVTEATVALEPVPETAAVALLSYDELGAAMADVAPILDHDPAAVEVMDDVLLELAREREAFRDVVELLPPGTDSVLLVEFYADSDREGRRKVAGLLADRCPVADPEGDPGDHPDCGPVRAVAAMEAHDPTRRERFWTLRKSGLPILLSRTDSRKHVSFVEDTAVPPERLPEYVERFQDVLDRHDTSASFYAHAGPGVLHIRPLVDTHAEDAGERMRAIAEEVTDLVVEFGGSVSGEHGDGRARTAWNRKLYGDRVFELFREVKTAFDPDWLLNPGQVCGAVDPAENLRFDAGGLEADFEPTLEYDENGFEGMVELCHGCGGCRGSQSVTGGVMCPTYRAEREELLSTRGRANALRAAMAGDLPDEELYSEAFREEVLDLCIGCKGCLRDCPSGVDMAKLKSELLSARHEREGADLRDRLFGRIHELSRLGAALAPLPSLLDRLPGAGRLRELAGIAGERSLPPFRRERFRDWAADRGSTVAHADAARRALVFPDTYTDHSTPGLGRDAVRVLEACGVRVAVPDTTGSGRPPYSKGLLGLARERARENVAALGPFVERGWDVVVLEPSDAVMIQSEYRDLLEDPGGVPGATYGFAEYLDRFDLLSGTDLAAPAGRDRLTYHSHCHQHATERDAHAPAVLRAAGHGVTVLDSGCCGMAGSFGYEREHYSMSAAIGSVLVDQLDDREGRVVAPGTSCRTQLADLADERAAHPAEVLADALGRPE
jgi:FAD/FMN-containing dehydrogenase/Fe-S oxidoreductase